MIHIKAMTQSQWYFSVSKNIKFERLGDDCRRMLMLTENEEIMKSM